MKALEGMELGLRNMARRMDLAEDDFIETLMERGGVSREAAGRVLATYRRLRVVKMDAVGGRMSVKHGAFMDRATIRRAAAQG